MSPDVICPKRRKRGLNSGEKVVFRAKPFAELGYIHIQQYML